MAEILGVVSGAAGLISLSLQLADDAQRLRRLYCSIKHAPQALEQTAHELDTYSHLIRLVDHDRERYSIGNTQFLEQSLGLCQQSVASIRKTVNKLESTLSRHPILGRIRTAFEEREMEIACEQLERAKSTLMQAMQAFYETVRRRDNDKVRQVLQNMQTTLDEHTRLLTQHRVASSLLNSIDSVDRTVTVSQAPGTKRSRHSTKHHAYRFRLKPWFVSRVWDLSLRACYSGWDVRIQSRRLVPADAPILQACSRGDLVEVRRLIAADEASPFDFADPGSLPIFQRATVLYSDDVTPFSCALNSGNLELAKYLFDCVGWSEERDSEFLSFLDLDQYWKGDFEREWCRVFFDFFDADTDFLTNGTLPSNYTSWWWWSYGNIDSVEFIQHRLPFPYAGLPMEIRLRNAFNLGRSNPPEIFTALAGISFSDPDLADATHDELLKFIIVEMCEPQREKEWKIAMTEALRARSRTGSPNVDGSVLLTTLIEESSVSKLAENLKWLLRCLYKADVDLYHVGLEWSPILQLRGLYTRNCKFMISDVVFGPTPDEWDLEVCLHHEFTVLDTGLPPGAWRGKDVESDLPELYVDDTPMGQTFLGGFSEQLIRPTRSLPFFSPPMRLSYFAERREDLNPHRSLISAAQDDAGIVPNSLLSSRKSYRTRWRRSHSAAPDLRNSWQDSLEESIHDSQNILGFHHQIHRCRRDGRWKPGQWNHGVLCIEERCGYASAKILDSMPVTAPTQPEIVAYMDQWFGHEP